MIKQRLFTPGPTDVPPEVLVEMAKPIFHHRTERFKAMFGAVNDGMKKLLKTQNDVVTIAGSGTAGMEAAIACAVPRDKKVLVADGGKFGERWVKVAKRYKLNVDEVKVEITRLMDELGKGGGYILSPCHNIQPDTPIRNVLAIYEEVAKRRGTALGR